MAETATKVVVKEGERPLGSIGGGIAATEKLANPGDKDYDSKMAELWGGPPPQHFDAALEHWSAAYGDGAGKLALVTGGTGGVGFYVVKMLAGLGYTVIMPQRPGFEEEATGAVSSITAAFPDAKLVVPETTLDLNSNASSAAFAAAVAAAYGQLDLLCLNAGRGGSVIDPRDVTSEGTEAVMQVNILGHFVLTAGLLPLLLASPAARVVSQTSGARFSAPIAKLGDLGGSDASATFSGFDQYCLSKAAMVLFTQALNDRLDAAGQGQVVACVSDPGLASTGVNVQHQLVISHDNLGRLVPEGTDTDLSSTNTLHDLAGHHAADGALPMVLASIAPGVKPNDWFSTPNKDGKPYDAPPTAAFDPADQEATAEKDPLVLSVRKTNASFGGI
jgi:NAD(P)-dependent dehydrogenase (short-subunit alcohol dehydrogenase family)